MYMYTFHVAQNVMGVPLKVALVMTITQKSCWQRPQQANDT